MRTHITGYEPRISQTQRAKKNRLWRLSPRNIANMLNLLPDDAISLDALEAALNSEHFYVRSSAAKRLVKRNNRDTRLVFESVLKTGNIPAKANIARHLYGLSWFSAQSLQTMAFNDTDPRVREGVVYSLSKMYTLNAYQLLHELVQHEEDDLVLGACAQEWGLWKHTDPLVVPILATCCRADDPEIRAKIMECLGTTEQQTALPILREAMLTDEAPYVCYNAALSYVEIAEIESVGVFSEIFRTVNDSARLSNILRGFFQATNYRHVAIAEHPHVDDLIDALTTVMRHSHHQVRWQGIWCLAWLKHARIPQIVLDIYHREKDLSLKIHFMSVAVKLMMARSDELLADALQSQHAPLREEAEKIRDEFGKKSL